MMTSHFGLLVLFGFFVSLTFAVLMRDVPAEQLALGAKLWGSFIGVGLALGWLMAPLPL
ncbi:MAG: hypothetical protein LC791_12110 [Acidobacteria bacterium]|nr:hypothetical protein [Acidobacteriota bacterium]